MKAILHADKEWGIGKNNDLMFKLPSDMRFFKKTTVGNVVVMGSNTLKSFPNGPLKDRVNVVFWPDGEDREDCVIVRTLPQLFSQIKNYESAGKQVYVIGGRMMFSTLLPYCDEVLLTKVDAVGGADVFFENLDEDLNFALTYESPSEITNGYGIKFTVYKNLNPQKY